MQDPKDIASPDEDDREREQEREQEAAGDLAETIESTGDEAHALSKAETLEIQGDENFAPNAPTLDSGDGQDPADSTDNPLFRSGGQIGRLQIGKTLGDGSFGVVVSAFDPELKRKLAIKILKPTVFESSGGEDAQKRLMREARAMARVSHPNVVAVHDIGTIDGQVYVAMQFVEGPTLGQWLGEEKRGWREILEKFVQAGRGLAAAHREGLVHRDFKPDNVLVGSQGDVRVADFGLVSISSNKNEGGHSGEFPARAISDDLHITRAGAVMGTALFMAPEQHLGKEVAPASDQFSFCAALYWALYEKQPFAGKNYEQLRRNVLDGKLQAPPPSSSVPRWLWSALRTGLAIPAEERYPSMDALLEVLLDDPGLKRRRRLKAGAIVLVLGTLFAALLWSRGDERKLCQHFDRKLEGVWDGRVKERARAVFAASSRGEGYALFEEALDRYADDWVAVRTRVCEATHLRGEQSASLLDMRMMCLDQRLQYLSELAAQIRSGITGGTLDKALRASTALPPLDACTRRKSPGGLAPLPPSPEKRKQIAAINGQIEKAQALFDLGAFAKASEVLESQLAAAIDYAPSAARATALLGRTKVDLGRLDQGEALLREGIEHATRAGDDILVARSWLALMALAGIEREDYERGHEIGALARLAMVRGQANEYQMATLDKARASILLREGKNEDAASLIEKILPIYETSAPEPELAALLAILAEAKAADAKFDEAISLYRLGLAHLESSLGKTHPDNIYILNNMAVSLKGAGDLAGARKALEDSLAAIERSYGSGSRKVVTVLVNLGNVLRREGDLSGAKTALQRAIEVGNQAMEEGHPTVTKAMMNLAIVLSIDHDYEGATASFREVLARTRESFEGDHPDTAMALNNLGESLLLEVKLEQALEYVLLARDMKARLFGAEHPKSASTLATLGSIYAQLGRGGEAVAALNKALAIYLDVAGEEHPRTIHTLSELGRLYESTGDPSQAVPYLQRAVEARGGSDDAAQDEDRFALVRALWGAKRHKEALELARALHGRIRAQEGREELAALLRGWLDSHP